MKIIYAVIVFLLLAITILPLWTVVVGAFTDWDKPFAERLILRWFTLDNLRVFRSDAVRKAHLLIGDWLRNSAVYCAVAALGQALITTAAGYGLARFRFVGREWLSGLLLAMIVVPGMAMYVPMFMVAAKLHLVGPVGFILPMLASAPSTLYARQFARGLSRETFEAARVDGASELQIFGYVALPMLAPIAMMTFSGAFCSLWANLMWANVTLRAQQSWTITQGLSYMIYAWRLADVRASFGVYSVVMLASAAVPAALYVVAQKYVAAGLEGLIQE